METKSRYEIIENLENQKRNLIREKNSFPDEVLKKEKNIKLFNRNWEEEVKNHNQRLEDLNDDLKAYNDSIKDKVFMIDELIRSVDASLERFNNKKD